PVVRVAHLVDRGEQPAELVRLEEVGQDDVALLFEVATLLVGQADVHAGLARRNSHGHHLLPGCISPRGRTGFGQGEGAGVRCAEIDGWGEDLPARTTPSGGPPAVVRAWLAVRCQPLDVRVAVRRSL